MIVHKILHNFDIYIFGLKKVFGHTDWQMWRVFNALAPLCPSILLFRSLFKISILALNFPKENLPNKSLWPFNMSRGAAAGGGYPQPSHQQQGSGNLQSGGGDDWLRYPMHYFYSSEGE